jgi:hypothetical protein
MEAVAVNNYIIKIVGLLGDVNPKQDFPQFLTAGYKKDLYPTDDQGKPDERKIQGLRDYFYPNFRNIMFLDDTKSGNYRLIKNGFPRVSLTYKKGNENSHGIHYAINIISSEIYVFDGYFGIFSLSVKIETNQEDQKVSLSDISNVLSIIRNFSTSTLDNVEWHSWISTNILCGKSLRGANVKADEYSGSKFKTYSVVEFEHDSQDRSNLLFDLATTSPLGSANGNTIFSPDAVYYDTLMQNRIGVFKNWEALASFDSLICVGNDQLSISWYYDSWNHTYFRIYLFRLFFKYNLHRYNSAIHSSSEDAVKLRDEFEKYLTRYNITHISFNFLPNEIYKKTGSALDLDAELNSFRDMINNLSKTIQEEKQARTNLLLQGVTILTSITSIGPIFDLLQDVEKYLGWTDPVFYSVLSILIISLGFGVLYFIMPEKLKRLWKKTQ